MTKMVWVRLETSVWARVGTDGSVERVVVDYDVERPIDGTQAMEGTEFGPHSEPMALTDDEVEQVDLAVDHIMSDGYPSERWELGPIGEAPGTLSKSIYQERQTIWDGIRRRGCGHSCGCLTMLREDLMRRGTEEALSEA